MNPLWRQVAVFVVALACAICALVAAGLEEESAASGETATTR